MQYPSLVLASLFLLLPAQAQTVQSAAALQGSEPKADCRQVIPDRAALEALQARRFAALGSGHSPLTADERRCLYAAEFEIWNQAQQIKETTTKLNRRKLRDVDEFMVANFDTLNVIYAGLRGPVGRLSDEANDRALIRIALYAIAERGALQSVGPDFISTLTFMLTGVGYEANPLFNILNSSNEQRTTFLLVTAASIVGAEVFAEAMRLIDPQYRPLLNAVEQFIRMLAVSTNNALLMDSRLPLTGFRVTKWRINNSSEFGFYIYPVSRVNHLELPRRTGLGVVYTRRF